MPSPGSTREEERRFNLRTLAIASIAAATAAALTSQFWIAGTPYAAALTPVIVALVSELLHRPTEKIVERFTSETDALPEAAGAGPPPRREAERREPAREASSAQRPVTIYRQPPKTQPGRNLPWGKILVTGMLAFALAAAALTLPELIAGQSLGKGNGTTSILGNNRDRDSGNEEEPEKAPAQPTTPEQTSPQQTPQQQRTTPTPAPQETTPQQQKQPQTQTTPAPAPKATP